ncbi:glycosyltransferase family 2 protein [Bradyrhizobium sp. 24]|uniref:glycosyltransferase family 2 protein n=1 Tax=unclassified Bradyrhizobium TaxID=2631580 RepID=UPI001FF79A7D|nr:glycosyltransferase family 2 protein [Bradyrhizobium sp. 37]MCK1378009.1 glycosyltransferase family 2 protein [Bradyrhizobium sp. 24]MCK1769319.1 glycosyltransferase family 2 protein [Bradyrhizobium sp. 134]
MKTIGVCLTSFNRREKTLRCLRSLHQASLPDQIRLSIYLVDDGSSDGTSSSIRTEFPSVRLFEGDGSLYWAGGMRIAYGAALERGHDYYLWLNDDVDLQPDSIQRAIATLDELRVHVGGEHVIVGAMSAEDGVTTTYSGLVRASRVFPWKFRKAIPDPRRPIECDTVNGNFVLVPNDVAHRIGNIHPAYVQMHADLVLGIKAKKMGARNWVMAGFAGVCDANTGRKNWNQPDLGLWDRLRIMQHPLGYPFKPNIAYSRNYGIWAPVVVAAPYFTLLRAWLVPKRS